MEFNIAVIKGDGIGPSVVDQALLTLDRVGEIYGHKFNYTEVLAGGCAIDATGRPLPQETSTSAKTAMQCFWAPVGGPKWDEQPSDNRPERALLGLRKELGLFANIRPAMMFEELATPAL